MISFFVFCAHCYITDCYIAILAFVTVLPLSLPAYQSAVDDKDAYHGNDSIWSVYNSFVACR